LIPMFFMIGMSSWNSSNGNENSSSCETVAGGMEKCSFLTTEIIPGPFCANLAYWAIAYFRQLFWKLPK
jgi:hypothetical protein